MFVINAQDGACPGYYTYNGWVDHIGGSLFFRLPSRILDALKYFGLYKFSSGMGTGPVLTALAFHRCGEVDWEKTVVKDGFVSYDFPTVEVYGLSEETVHEKKRIRGVDGVPTTVTVTRSYDLPYRCIACSLGVDSA